MDGDAFFVAVEVAKNPRLRGLPVVTGGERGIVSALSYEAKAIGIVRGMPIFRLRKEFPQVIVLPGDYRSYARYSTRMFDIVRRYADLVEEYSIDECFADLTGLDRTLINSCKMSYREIAERIQKEIWEELDISVSIGVAPTKVLAKVASKWIKPKGLTVITAETAPQFLSTTPIDKVWGIGRQTSWFLKKKGIQTALQFATQTREWVLEHLSRPYEALWYELNSTPVSAVDPLPKTIYSSIQKTRTFHPATNNQEFLVAQLALHTESACAKARRYSLVPRSVSFFIKSSDFRYASHSVDLVPPTNAPEIIAGHIRSVLARIHSPGVKYRSSGVRLHGLIPSDHRVNDLFGEGTKAQKFEAVHQNIDVLEHKWGKRLVFVGRVKEEGGEEEEDLESELLFL